MVIERITDSGRWGRKLTGLKAIVQRYDADDLWDRELLGELRRELYEALEATGVDRLVEIAEEIHYEVETMDELDDRLEDLYDWGDSEGVWIE